MIAYQNSSWRCLEPFYRSRGLSLVKEGRLQNTLKQFAGVLQQPAAILTVAGGFVMAGAVLSFDFMPVPLQMVGRFVKAVFLDGVMQQLPLFFCVGVTCALAKRKKGEAVLVAIVSFLVYVHANHYWLKYNDMLAEPLADTGLFGTGQGMILGLQVVDAGVFIGIVLACINAFFLNHFSNKESKSILSIYGACLPELLFATLLGVAMCYVWPICSKIILLLVGLLSRYEKTGLFFYYFLQRFLISTGLHHLVYMPFYYSQLGGTFVLDGMAYSGARVIWYAEIANIEKISALHDSVRY